MENSLLFSASMDRSKRTPRDFALPGWTDDLLTKYRGGKLDVPPETVSADGGVLRLRPAARDAAGQGQAQRERALGPEPHGNHPVRTAWLQGSQPTARLRRRAPTPGFRPAASAAERTC